MIDEYTAFPVSFMLAIGEARESGAKAERERIIALLETAGVDTDTRYGSGWHDAIALIKEGME